MRPYIALGVLLLVVLLSACTTTLSDETPALQGEHTQGEQSLHDTDYIWDLPYEEVTPEEEEAMAMCLDDEYKARATYEKIIEDLGVGRPFTNIINSEVNHINQLLVLYEKYNLTPAPDQWTGNIPPFASIEEACAGGAQAEIDNYELYVGLFAQVDNEDIIAVFTKLESDSRVKHLPAFQRCMARK